MRCRKMASQRGGKVGVVVTGCCTSGENLPDPSHLNMQEKLRNKCFSVQFSTAAGVSASDKMVLLLIILCTFLQMLGTDVESSVGQSLWGGLEFGRRGEWW